MSIDARTGERIRHCAVCDRSIGGSEVYRLPGWLPVFCEPCYVAYLDDNVIVIGPTD